ncbi:MAG: hypothetical protein WBZ31_01730 [Thiobacillus sp.]
MSLLLLMTSPAFAQSDYRCVIQRIVTAEQAPNSILTFNERNYLGKEFTVERNTGLMAGALKNSYVTKPQVIDPGSKGNAFKVVTTMRLEQGAGAGSNVYVLTINEFSSSPKKPFVFVENDEVFLGVCEHF